MFTKSAVYYDKIYAFKDYEGEVRVLKDIIGRELRSGGDRLLDIGCGTGKHLQGLKREYRCEGLDVNPDLLEIAKARNPELTFHLGDMMALDLGRPYDVILCLFGSIGYLW
jgi:ubiquinone/menaquinone biosynthesis C-methylase UbiE